MTLTVTELIGSLSLALSVVVAIVSWIALMRKHFDRRLDVMDRKVQTLDRQVTGMPNRDELHGLELALSAISGDLKAMDAKIGSQVELMTRIDRVVTRHEDHLLSGGK